MRRCHVIIVVAVAAALLVVIIVHVSIDFVGMMRCSAAADRASMRLRNRGGWLVRGHAIVVEVVECIEALELEGILSGGQEGL